MPQVYMFPNPRFGMPTASGEPEESAHLADPHVAHLPGVAAHLEAAAKTIAARAAGRLATVKAGSATSAGAQGSRITVERGALDRYVKLDDTRSDGAAWKIEADHGILTSSAPRGQASLERPEGFVIAAGFPDRKPPKGLVVNLEPT